MADKDVERNVRSTTVEGIRTPTERHVHGLGEQNTISFGEKFQESKKKEKLLEKFRRREKGKRPAGPEKSMEEESVEPGEGAGAADTTD